MLVYSNVSIQAQAVRFSSFSYLIFAVDKRTFFTKLLRGSALTTGMRCPY
jgi:hypothetical protein